MAELEQIVATWADRSFHELPIAERNRRMAELDPSFAALDIRKQNELLMKGYEKYYVKRMPPPGPDQIAMARTGLPPVSGPQTPAVPMQERGVMETLRPRPSGPPQARRPVPPPAATPPQAFPLAPAPAAPVPATSTPSQPVAGPQVGPVGPFGPPVDLTLRGRLAPDPSIPLPPSGPNPALARLDATPLSDIPVPQIRRDLPPLQPPQIAMQEVGGIDKNDPWVGEDVNPVARTINTGALGMVGGLAQGSVGAAGGLTQAAGGILDSDTLRQTGQDMSTVANALSPVPEQIQKDPLDDPSVLAKPEWWAYAFGQGLGSMLPMLATGMGAGKAIEVAIRSGRMSPQIAAALAKWGPSAVGGVTEGLTAGATAYDEAIREGKSEQEALKRMAIVASGTAATSVAALKMGVFSDRIKSPFAKGTVTSIGEGTQEVGQTGIENLAADRPLSQGMVQAGVSGMLTGAAVGGALGQSQPEEIPQIPQTETANTALPPGFENYVPGPVPQPQVQNQAFGETGVGPLGRRRQEGSRTAEADGVRGVPEVQVEQTPSIPEEGGSPAPAPETASAAVTLKRPWHPELLTPADAPVESASAINNRGDSDSKSPAEMTPEEFQQTLEEPGLASLHNHMVRVKGMDVAPESAVRRFFRQVEKFAKKYGGESAIKALQEAEFAYERGDIAKAVQASEYALSLTHTNHDRTIALADALYEEAIRKAIADRRPFHAEAVESILGSIPEGYIEQGDLYIPVRKPTPAPAQKQPWELPRREYLENDIREQRRRRALTQVEDAISAIGREHLETAKIMDPGESPEQWIEREAKRTTTWTSSVPGGNRNRRSGQTAIEYFSKPWNIFRNATAEKHLQKAALEYVRGNKRTWLEDGESFDSPNVLTRFKHEQAVRAALAEGKTVPPEVLAEYPDLTTPAPEEQGAGAPQGAIAPVQETPNATPSREGVIQPEEGAASGAQPQAAETPTKHKFSSTQVNLPDPVASTFREVGAWIPDEDLAEDGREDEPHVTVKYGLHTDKVDDVRRVLANEPPVRVKLGRASLFQNDDADVLKVDVDSPDLHRLNKKIADALEVTDTHPDYKPHATIAYLKPGKGEEYIDNPELDSQFEGKEITLSSIVFSSKTGEKVEIPLAGAVPAPPRRKGPPQARAPKAKAAKAAASMEAQKKLVGGFYVAYGGGTDEILNVDFDQVGSPVYTVRDVETGRVRQHQTPIDPGKVTFKPAPVSSDTAPAKEPWQMTRSEYERGRIQRSGIRGAGSPHIDSIAQVKPARGPEGADRVMLPDGTIWEYKGISGYKADNANRVNGWENITLDITGGHREAVERAVREGKTVPAEVLAEYPQLKQEPPAAPASGSQDQPVAPVAEAPKQESAAAPVESFPDIDTRPDHEVRLKYYAQGRMGVRAVTTGLGSQLDESNPRHRAIAEAERLSTEKHARLEALRTRSAKELRALAQAEGVDISSVASDKYAKFRIAERIDHARQVRQAVAEGKPVPTDVLADYPDLAPQEAVLPAGPPQGRKRKSSEAGFLILPVPARQPEPKSPKFTFENEDVQKRIDAASQPPEQEATIDRILTGLKEAFQGFRRTYEKLPRKQYHPLIFRLKQFEKSASIASQSAVENIMRLTSQLDRNQYDLYRYKVLFDDLNETYQQWKEKGQLPEGAEDVFELAFGVTPEVLDTELPRLQEAIDADPKVKAALDQRQQIWNDIRDEYIPAMKEAGEDVEERFQKQFYFRHRVLQHIMDKQRETAQLGSAKVRTPAGRGFLKRRSVDAAAMDYSADYISSEYEVMAQIIADTRKAEFIGWLKDGDNGVNILKKLKQDAKWQNVRTVMPYFHDLAMALNAEMGVEPGDDGSVSADDMFRRTLNRKQAMAVQKFGKLAADGDLPDGDGKWSSLLEALADDYIARQEDFDSVETEVDMPELIRYASWLLKEAGPSAGSKPAGLLMRGIREKAQSIREIAGDKYVEWRDLIPEGYVEWQPREGNVFYTGYTVPEQIAKQMFERVGEQMGITADDLRKALIVGGKRTPLVIPKEVAETLDNLGGKQPSAVGKAAAALQNKWKEWQLISPPRVVKYNLRNLSGDAEITFAGNPRAFRQVRKAAQDIVSYYRSLKDGDPKMSGAMRAWFERGGFQSTLQVQEIGDLRNIERLERLLEQHGHQRVGPPGSRLKTAPEKAWRLIFNKAKLATDAREALLRYANFLEYAEQIGENGKPLNYGASKPEEVDALEDRFDKAYKLSNDLLGAYDEVSVAGQSLRRYVIPFWSFQELNMRRYAQLIRNASRDQKLAGLVGRKLMGQAVLRSPYLAYRVGSFAIKAAGLWALLHAWNEWMFPEEERSLREDIRKRPHVILGKHEDGSVRYFSRLGNIPDLWEWFDPEDGADLVRDWLNGKATALEAAGRWLWYGPAEKVILGASPFAKVPFELAYGRSAYPSLERPRAIYDKAEYLADHFGLGDIYRHAFGKPVRSTPFAKAALNVASYEADPKQSAYYDILDLKADWQVKNEKGGQASGGTSLKHDALRNMKLALRYGDKDAFAKYIAEYAAKGGTPAGLKQSIRFLHPLAGLNRQDAAKFRDALNEEDRKRLALAVEYYEETFAADRIGEFVRYAQPTIQKRLAATTK